MVLRNHIYKRGILRIEINFASFQAKERLIQLSLNIFLRMTQINLSFNKLKWLILI